MIPFDPMSGRLCCAVASLLIVFAKFLKAQEPATLPLKRHPHNL